MESTAANDSYDESDSEGSVGSLEDFVVDDESDGESDDEDGGRTGRSAAATAMDTDDDVRAELRADERAILERTIASSPSGPT